MAESSIKARIAALNLEEVHPPSPGIKPSYTYDAVTAKKKPPPPPPSQRPPAYQRQQTINNPPILSNAPTSARQLGNLPSAADSPKASPALPPRPPPRNNSASNGNPKPSPALPPRRPSENRSLTRRESTESISTIASGISTLSLGSNRTGTSNGNGTLYQVRAPAYDPSKLPPLPPKKAPEEKSATRNAMKSKRDFVPSQTLPPSLSKSPELPARPSLPPRQPTVKDASPERPPLPGRPTSNTAPPPKTTRFVAPVPTKSILQMGFNNKPVEPPPVPQNRPTSASTNGATNGSPPPVPMSSRPNLDAIMASKPKPGAVASSCLICRDFSAPDQHAARFPRTQLPSSDAGWLAQQLCSPFPSATDKARAIFTWLHHNIDYDVHSFFSGNISPSTPERTISSGLAVCEGYAGLFAALALKAGLEAIVCSGDSKGFGHTPLMPGDPLPAFDSNHAWNAVRIDNGEWKLLDACWGAGHVGCQMKNEGYIRSFNPAMFTMSNNDFGMKHFPSDNSHQFRTDGRVLSFEEFKRDDMGGRVIAMGGCKDEGVDERSIYPSQLNIKVHDPQGPPVVRFQFSTHCQHWDNARHGAGPPHVLLLNVAGRDGRNTQYLPFNTDGRTWWLDVDRLELGAVGQKINVTAVTEFCGKPARGLSYETWNNKRAYSAKFGHLCSWVLV